VAYWIKINYERNEYVVDLDHISAFACAPNGKITFWLSDNAIPIIVTQQSNSDDYYKVFNYVQQISAHSLTASWFRIIYERSEYLIDLNRISNFCCASGKLKFWLPDSAIPIIINKHSDPDSYQKLLDYIQHKTGQSFSC